MHFNIFKNFPANIRKNIIDIYDIMDVIIDGVNNIELICKMNIQQIQYILAVEEWKHFEQAAEHCFVTQSTLSTMIGRYEEEIGIKIFDRKTKPLTITHEGKLIIQQLRLIQKEMDGLDNIIQELKGEMIGSLRLGIIPTVAPYILPLFLANFAKVFPKLRIVVQEMTTPEIVKALKNRSLDVGIAAIPLADEELLEDQLYIESFLLFDCYSKKIARKVTIDSLDYEHLLLLQEGHCLRTQVEQICKLSKINTSKTTNFEFKAGSIDSLIRYAKANKGITLLPYMSTLDLPQDDRLRLSTFISPVPVRSIGLVVHRHFVKKRILQELIKIIKLQIAPKLPTIAKQQVFNPY